MNRKDRLKEVVHALDWWQKKGHKDTPISIGCVLQLFGEIVARNPDVVDFESSCADIDK